VGCTLVVMTAPSSHQVKRTGSQGGFAWWLPVVHVKSTGHLPGANGASVLGGDVPFCRRGIAGEDRRKSIP
jgi:hypothetical protein